MINKHRQWLYSKDCPKGRIFEEGEDVPEGYVDSPAKLQDVAKKKAAPKRKHQRRRLNNEGKYHHKGST